MRFLLPLVTVLVVLAVPSAAHAATCSDYSNQAAAQRAADTRDADGDGKYCETLPCPCAGAGGGNRGGGGGSRPAPRPRPKAKPKKRAQVISARITRVVDGDTVKVRAFGAKRKFYTVRLIGIDTPETKKPGRKVECGGKRATSFMLGLSFAAPIDSDGDNLADEEGGDGRRVTLVTDPTQDTFDGFGRLLAYVTTRSGDNLQAILLSAGWAKVYIFRGKPFQRLDRHRSAQGRARAKSRGVWKRCGGNFHKVA